jgi:Tol biopolymer transport system component
LTLPIVCAAQEKIVFVSNRDGNNEIYAMNPDGSNQINLTDNSANDTDPYFSSDGSKIAFIRDSQLFVMNVDGTNPTQLTNSPLSAIRPAFSPEGSRIAFSRLADGGGDI